MRRICVLSVLMMCGFMLSCADEESSQSNIAPGPRLSIEINHVFDGVPLALNTDLQTADGTTVQISKLRYWLSNVQLHRADGTHHAVPAAYYLLEQTAGKTRNKIIMGGIPDGEYTGLTLAMGVDEAHNHSTDLFEGELSTAVNMDWGWNSGFIFLKVEGTVVDSDSTASFLAHVGNDVLYREVSMTFDSGIVIDTERDGAVQLTADVKSLFNDWDVVAVSDIIGGSETSPAGTVATNYAQWFSLQSATSQESAR